MPRHGMKGFAVILAVEAVALAHREGIVLLD
jgi:hypothetical protein